MPLPWPRPILPASALSAGLLGDALREGVPVEHGVGVERDERGERERRPRRLPSASVRQRAVLRDARERGRDQRERDDAAGVLRRRGQAEPEPGEQVGAPAAVAHDAGASRTATGTPPTSAGTSLSASLE